MFVIRDMTQVTVYIVIATFFLLFFALRKSPFRAAGTFVQELFTSRKYFLHFVVMFGILFINKLELWVEGRMNLQSDFTPSVFKLDGNFVAGLQHFFMNDMLTVASTYFYVVIFPCLMITSIGIYTSERNYKLYYAICYAMMFNYMIAIPFYLFFPVSEVWSFHPHVEFLMKSVFPSFETEYRPLSGLNNCFPSLHTSISVSMAVIAHRSNNVFWRRFTKFTAVFIIFSIFYLGVHWLTDMLGGLMLGLLAGTVAVRLSEGRSVAGAFAGNMLKSRDFGK